MRDKTIRKERQHQVRQDTRQDTLDRRNENEEETITEDHKTRRRRGEGRRFPKDDISNANIHEMHPRDIEHIPRQLQETSNDFLDMSSQCRSHHYG